MAKIPHLSSLFGKIALSMVDATSAKDSASDCGKERNSRNTMISNSNDMTSNSSISRSNRNNNNSNNKTVLIVPCMCGDHLRKQFFCT